ncbi:MAG TPA: PD-(D/E)XK nuclease family protein, partial [Bdellovibrio sp.]|nr:PD-(D/E)XK nuclease family protein [Bdellovibrio sp.]
VTGLVSSATLKNPEQPNEPPSASHLGSGLARAQQGTNAHRLFEALKYSSPENLLTFADDDLKEPLRFLATTQEIPMMDIINRGHVEWGFALLYEKSLMQGQIDLWGILDQTLWIVDYKTGSQKYSETAFKQLEVYTWALYRMKYLTQVYEVKLAVVYPMDKAVKVRTLESLEELDARMVAVVREDAI